MSHSKINYIFTDGACSYNPGPGGYGAIVLTADEQVVELGGHQSDTTNNQMEILATIKALDEVRALNGETRVYTDSKYLIQAITEWMPGWKRRGWKTSANEDVKNKDYFLSLEKTIQKLNSKLRWIYVPGHSGHPGNERADEIAVSFSKNRSVRLFQGDFSRYSHDLLKDIEKLNQGAFKSLKKKSSSSKKAHSYISMIHGDIAVHTNWKDCQARVNGVSGAKFKKSVSSDDEKKIISEFKKMK